MPILFPDHLNLNVVNCMIITTDIMCDLHLLTGPKVIGNILNHTPNGHFWIFDWKYCAVNDCLEFGSHRHHWRLGFVLVMLLQALTATAFLLSFWYFAFSFSVCMLNWIAFRCLAIALLVCLKENLFCCFCRILEVSVFGSKWV